MTLRLRSSELVSLSQPPQSSRACRSSSLHCALHRREAVMPDNAALSLVRRFEQLQEERVHTYRMFEEGHKIYLSSGPMYDFPTFRKLVHDVTQDFKRISQDIIELEQTLRNSGEGTIADIIATVQDCEKKKLELTTHMQLAKQMVADNSDGELEKTTERDIRAQLGQVVEEINEHLTELRYEVHCT